MLPNLLKRQMNKNSRSFHTKPISSALLKLLLWLLLLTICNTTPSYFDFTLDTTPLTPATNGFKLKGLTTYNRYGRSVNSAGDIDNDGYDDIVVGTYAWNSNTGIVYVYYGGDTSSLANLDMSQVTINPQTQGFTIKGSTTSDQFGWSVSTAGDIDKDGYDDIVVGAYGRNSNQGAVYVIYGGSRASRTHINLATALIPSSTGFTITGAGTNSFLGYTVSTAGDVNKDGYADIIVSAENKYTGRGEVYVIYGRDRSLMANIVLSSTPLDPLTTGFVISGNAANDNLGFSVNTAGDINKDGYSDVLIGASGKASASGAAYVIYGGEKTSMRHWDFSVAGVTLDPLTTGFMLTGQTTGDKLGYSMSSAGDINNDGYADIIVGASDKNSLAGVAYVIYGGEKSSMRNWDFSAGATLDPLTTGFLIKGNAPSDRFGASVSLAGDMNKDGYNDMIIGAFGKNTYRGAAYVIYGGPKTSMANLDLSIASTLNPLTTGFKITGYMPNSWFGFPVSIAGDINKDGYKDIIIGAYGENTYTGAAYIIHTACTQCLSCQANCDVCPMSPGICTSCTIPYLIYQSQCYLTCPDTSFPSSTTCQACSTNCKKCSSLSLCTECISPFFLNVDHCVSTCPDTFFGSTATGSCESCEPNCNKCSDASSCNECISPFLLYQSQCISACPMSTIADSGKCEACPENCFYCTSKNSCQACTAGYDLVNSACVVFSPQGQTQGPAQAKASRAISSATQAIGGVVCVGSVTFPVTALVSSIVQNTRYLNISVSNDLSEIYKTWDTDLISWDVPNVISDFDHFKESPPLFYQYGLGSSFLANFWPTLVNIGIGLGTFIASFVLRKLLEVSEYNRGWAYSLSQKLMMGSFNFSLIQIYACMDNILFYLVLDVKTNPFNSFYSWTSVISASLFLAFGCLLIFFNFWTVVKYQAIKTQNVKDLDAFNARNKYWELFYSDFNDDGLFSQSFFAFLIIRSTLSSFIVTILYDYPIMQTSYLIMLDGVVIIFLITKKPFTTLESTLCQYYFEIITLLVHICTFILAMQDTFQVSSDLLRTILSTGIIYLNTALVSGTIGFMFVEICKTIRHKIKENKEKKEEISVHPAPEETQNLTTSPFQNPPTSLHSEQDASLENLHYFSGIHHHNHSNTSIKRRRKEPPRDQDFNLNMENPVLSDMNTNQIINGLRDQDTQSIMVQHRPRIQRKRPRRINPPLHIEEF